jgi:inosine-uridine nucleoside N-ribohydrolase
MCASVDENNCTAPSPPRPTTTRFGTVWPDTTLRFDAVGRVTPLGYTVTKPVPPGSVTVIGLGPVTNLALAFATEPALADRVAEIVLMSGALGEGNITPSAEFNAWNDPEALAVLLRLGRPLAIAPLDLTAQAFVTPDVIAALSARGGGACLAAALAILRAAPTSQRFGHRGFPLHDPCAVAWAIAPGLFGVRAAHAEMDLAPGPSRGRTVFDRWGRLGRASNVTLLETLDAPAFFDLLGERLAALP